MSPRHLFPVAGFAALWVVVAALTPNVTFHLAPVIVAAAPAITSPPDSRIIAGLTGFGLATAVAVGLDASGLLGGPSLLPYGGALLESILAAAVGALFAGRATVRG